MPDAPNTMTNKSSTLIETPQQEHFMAGRDAICLISPHWTHSAGNRLADTSNVSDARIKRKTPPPLLSAPIAHKPQGAGKKEYQLTVEADTIIQNAQNNM